MPIDDIEVQATAHRIVTQTPLMKLIDEAIATTNQDKIFGIAGEISKATASQTPCKNGCSHCCYMGVMITDFEARKIADHTNRQSVKQSNNLQQILDGFSVEKYAGVPCVFLGDKGECTIYPVRPLACRLHHNLNVDASNCVIKLPLENTEETPSINFNEISFWFANLSLRKGEAFGDIRDYFPSKEAIEEKGKRIYGAWSDEIGL